MPNPHAPRTTHHAPRFTFHVSRFTSPASRPSRAFTLIEIAICLAVIGFALIAIVGILPIGMNTQKANRQETIVNQDATVLLDAIRNGEQGLDDLTNYVAAISIVEYLYTPQNANLNPHPTYASNWYSFSRSSTPLLLTNGFHIVGLLSTPKYIPLPPQGAGLTYLSNHVVAYVRSISGPAAEKAPATYTATPLQDLAFNLGFNYRLISDVVPYFGYDTNGNQLTMGVPAGAWGYGPDYAGFTQNLQANLHDVRLSFRWPLRSDGSAGPGYQVFRAAAAGTLSWTNEFDAFGSLPAATNLTSIPIGAWPTELFFFEPRTYLQVQTP